MTKFNPKFVGNIPENYDRYLGPIIFTPYAGDLSKRIHLSTDANKAFSLFIKRLIWINTSLIFLPYSVRFSFGT